jgi:hypothetical protein
MPSPRASLEKKPSLDTSLRSGFVSSVAAKTGPARVRQVIRLQTAKSRPLPPLTASDPLTSPISHPGKLTRRIVLGSYVGAFLVFLASLALTFEGRLWVSQLGDVSSVSLASVSVIYVLSQHRFRSVGYSEAKSVVLGVLFANAFLQVYELIYGLTFVLSGALAGSPSISGTQARTIVLWIIMISPVLLVREHLTFNRTSGALLAALGAVWVTWILYGFPQYYYSGYAFPQILMTTDSFDLSLWVNFGSKALLAALFVSLLEPLKALNDALARPSPPESP